MQQHFLVTGGGGYLGSVIVPLILESGQKVTVVDRFFWGKEVLAPHNNLTLLEIDTRALMPNHFKNVDVVIDLAALSNDPIAELNPQITMDINYAARAKNAALARQAGVKKYILASSCSVYGFTESMADENSMTNPLTTYARASLLAEKEILKLSDNHFCTTVLRQGTLFGISPRMRFDLVLNSMVLSLFKNNSMLVKGGDQWRPIVHVNDSALAFLTVAEANTQKVNGQIFNVGATNQNYQVKNLADAIKTALKSQSNIVHENNSADNRSYKVSFEKITSVLGFKPKISLAMGAKEVHKALLANEVSDTKETKTIDWYKHLLSENPNILNA